MKDLRIVIVSWNVRDCLERCLLSLSDACVGLEWECLVVDNNSADGSAKMVREEFAHDDHIDIIANPINIGFSRACNQGTIQHKARNILLLNPDTICPPGSLSRLVKIMDAKSEVGIMGPKILNPDGTVQPSVRSFPTLKDQAMILLKLHRIFPHAPCLNRYLRRDLQVDVAQEVDQVMGACFLVKATCWDEMRGLDQRYFIWFEEVDACRQARDNGWKIWYEPGVSVEHVGGQTFAKAYTVRKQRYFNESLRLYMYKWHGWAAGLVVALLNPISFTLAAGVGVYKRLREFARQPDFAGLIKKSLKFKLPCYDLARQGFGWLAIIAGLELISAVVHGWPVGGTVVTILIALGMAVISFLKPATALSLVATEVIIGGFGYLLQADVPYSPIVISLRMALMAGFFLGWSINAIRARVWQYWRLNELQIVQVWMFVAGMVTIALAWGWHLHQPYLFEDFKAWLFLLYFIPVLDVAHRFGVELKRSARVAIVVGVLWISLEIISVFFIFSHGMTWYMGLYDWIRDTRVGEITPVGGRLYRIFFQSAIYTIFALLGVATIWLERGVSEPPEALARGITQKFLPKPTLPIRCLVPGIWILALAAVLLTLSRSFWLGLAMGLCLIAIVGIVRLRKQLPLFLGRVIAGSLAAFMLIIVVAYFPYPPAQTGSLAAFFESRSSLNDAAATSRWNLWPAMWQKIRVEPILGQGLGSTVTYVSHDPRVLKDHPDGLYTTYAFEWGWLAFWIKFGIFGIPIMLWLVISLAWRLAKSEYTWWFRVSGIATLVALVVIHFFTPYLNNPLGFAWLLGIEGALAIKRGI